MIGGDKLKHNMVVFYVVFDIFLGVSVCISSHYRHSEKKRDDNNQKQQQQRGKYPFDVWVFYKRRNILHPLNCYQMLYKHRLQCSAHECAHSTPLHTLLTASLTQSDRRVDAYTIFHLNATHLQVVATHARFDFNALQQARGGQSVECMELKTPPARARPFCLFSLTIGWMDFLMFSCTHYTKKNTRMQACSLSLCLTLSSEAIKAPPNMCQTESAKRRCDP